MNGHYTFRLLSNRKLNELYASMAIRSLALSMISVFIPIYLLTLDYSLPIVLAFYAILNGTHALFVIPAAKIASRMGCKHAILYSIPLLILFYALLHSLETFGWPLWLLAIVLGMSSSLFWMGYHTDFSRVSQEKHRGKQIGFANILAALASVAGPLFGGLILVSAGFQLLFAVVVALLLASAIPLFFSKDIREPVTLSVQNLFARQTPKNYLAFLGHGIEGGAGNTLWPIFIFFAVLNSLSALGFVTTLSFFFSMLATLLVAEFSDIRRRLVLKIGSLLGAAVWAARALVSIPLHVYIVDSFYGLSKNMRVVPFDALSYDKANKTRILEFNVFREVTIATGRVILFVVMIFISDLTVSFIFGGGASLFYLFF